jgi:nucleoside-diphosphate-sugar epimerase
MTDNESLPRVVLLGCGDIGSQLGLLLRSRGHPVLGLRRRPHLLPEGLPGLALDYTDPVQLRELKLKPSDILVFTPKPVSYDAAGYQQGFPLPVQALLESFKGGSSRRILYVSSTRVYGQDEGQWVDESTPVLPTGFAAEAIVEAENLLLQSPHQVSLVRFAGIYGRLPSRLLQRIARGQVCAPQPVCYGNRIHWQDCVGLLDHLLHKLVNNQQLERIYIGVDDAPVSHWEVESWLAQQMGVIPDGEAYAAGRSANKRCSNRRLHDSGYRLQYPDYRAGYALLLAGKSTGP